jgi:lysophospholipase
MTYEIDRCFLPPQNWQCDFFNNPETGHEIRFCYLMSEDAKANLIIMPGLSEFCEKYIETVKFFHSYHFNVFVIDWAYQGYSTRHPVNYHKRHSDGYDTDISDLNFLIRNKILQDKPLYCLAHSMGGHLALRYMIENPNIIKAAAISAPMIKIRTFRYGGTLAEIILKFLTPLHNKYVPGGHDWRAENRPSNQKDVFSSDPKRKKIHNYWNLTDTKLQIGSPTLKWLYESLKSIGFLKSHLKEIKTPLILASAEKETLVDNESIKKFANLMSNAELLELTDSRHEILMEKDEVRDKFLNAALHLFKQSM